MTETDVIVAGGGIAGLVVAWELSRAGRRVTVLEAGPTLGGAVARHVVGGLNLDAGAESFATTGGAVAALLRDLGLADRIVDPNPVGAWVLHEGGADPLPVGGLLGIPAHPWAPDVRRVIGPLAALRAGAERWLPRQFGAGQSTLGGWVGQRMGARVVRRLVEPVAGGVYSADPDRLETASVNPALIRAFQDRGSLQGGVAQLRGAGPRPGSAASGLIGGMFTLIEALTAAIRASGGGLCTGTPVRRIEQRPDGWSVHLADGQLNASDLVLAVDGPAHALLLNALGTPAPPAATSEVVLVTLVIDAPALDAAPRGTGMLVSRHVRGVSAKAITQATAKWAWLAEQAGPGRHVLRLSYGRGTEALPDGAGSVELALADASTLLGVPLPASRLVGSDTVRWASALPQPQVGRAVQVAELRSSLAAGLAVAGSVVAGTGLAAVVADARRVAAGLLG